MSHVLEETRLTSKTFTVDERHTEMDGRRRVDDNDDDNGFRKLNLYLKV